MQITQVKIRLIPNRPRLKAIASITLDDELIINDIKVIQAEQRLCVAFPNHQYAQANHLEFIVPLNCEVRKLLETAILGAYRKQIKTQAL